LSVYGNTSCATIVSMALCVDQWPRLQLKDKARKPGLGFERAEYLWYGRCKMKFETDWESGLFIAAVKCVWGDKHVTNKLELLPAVLPSELLLLSANYS